MSSVVVTAANIMGSILVNKTVEVENWPPKYVVQVIFAIETHRHSKILSLQENSSISLYA